MQLAEDREVLVHFDGHKAEIVINRPEALNALNADLLKSLLQARELVAQSTEARVVILSSVVDKAFVSGADIRFMNSLGPAPLLEFVELGQRVMRSFELLPIPVVSFVNGYCLGGGFELALSTDLIVANRSAKFGFPEINLGLIPGFGGTQRAALRIGPAATKRLALTGDLIGAEEAQRIGLVDYLADDGQLREVGLALVDKLCKKGPLGLRAAKRVLNAAQEEHLLAGLRREVESFVALLNSKDFKEGTAAFLEKREARFVGG